MGLMKNRHQIAQMAHLWDEVTRLLLGYRAMTKLTSQEATSILNRVRIAEHDSLGRLADELKPALTAATDGAWTSTEFEADIGYIRARLTQGQYEDARIFSSALVYQRKPDNMHYEHLSTRQASFWRKAYASWLLAHSEHEKVVERSLTGAAGAISERLWHELSLVKSSTEKWRFSFEQMTRASSFQSDVIWILFWSMFLSCEDIATRSKYGLPHENVVNGWVASILNRRFSDFALPEIQALGYPESTSFTGVFELSNSAEETLLGADFGIYFEIDIGDVRCRKVALLQAKKVNEGQVDVGSTKQQLRKLLRRSQLGYYLFYHHGTYPYQPQGPTICSALDIASQDSVRNSGIDAETLAVSVNDLGEAAMHFFTFGLFQSNSGIGVDVVDIHDGMNVLGGGSPLNLPRHLFAVAISNEVQVLRLRESIMAHFRELTKDELLRQFHANSEPKNDSLDLDDVDGDDASGPRPRM
ncbi:hypothetical protein ACN9MY_06185 [Pseudoduganella sp. R-31]|uniref:hypothetical protein n=1 Tax=Pseudoduganella sp. R-31 TaxID=3404060 RepID=UPI003CF673BC